MLTDNTQNIIMSTDVEERIQELVELRDEPEPFRTEDVLELDVLQKLNKDGEESSEDWKYGATLIRDSYFEEYARDLAEEIEDMPNFQTWPTRHMRMDWKAAAEELQSDYCQIDYLGVEYWVQ